MAVAKIRPDLSPDYSTQEDSSGNVILIPKEFQVYSNAFSLVNRPSVSALGEQATDLMKDILRIALTDSKFLPTTYSKFQNNVLDWEERWRTLRINSAHITYTTLEDDLISQYDSRRCGELGSTDMRQYIPIPFAVFGAAFLALFFCFTTLLFVGIFTGTYLINPWYNLMLCVSSLGLTTTDIVAILESRKWLDRDEPKSKR